ncbi:MAG: glutamate synthase-related protein, partial [Pseudomonadota bacterium]
MDFLMAATIPVLNALATFFIVAVGLGVLTFLFLFISDRTQSRDAIRHNYPVIGRFRDLFTHLGEFFRQYFFALDREEMPFNRAERDWIYKSSKGRNNTIPFGSTRNLTLAGTPIFVNCAFPKLDDEALDPPAVRFGPYTPNPYDAASIINISGMSYGALSKPAVKALSHGAKKAGCWMNTGEGGLSPYHLSGGADIVFQIGTAKYGVRHEDGQLSDQKLAELANRPEVKMIEVKMAQG